MPRNVNAAIDYLALAKQVGEWIDTLGAVPAEQLPRVRRHLPHLRATLVARGYEVTAKTARRPLHAQVLAVVREHGWISLRALDARVAGASSAEIKKVVASSVADGALAMVLRGSGLGAALPGSSDLVSSSEIEELLRGLAAAQRLARKAKTASAKTATSLMGSDVRALLGRWAQVSNERESPRPTPERAHGTGFSALASQIVQHVPSQRTMAFDRARRGGAGVGSRTHSKRRARVTAQSSRRRGGELDSAGPRPTRAPRGSGGVEVHGSHRARAIGCSTGLAHRNTPATRQGGDQDRGRPTTIWPSRGPGRARLAHRAASRHVAARPFVRTFVTMGSLGYTAPPMLGKGPRRLIAWRHSARGRQICHTVARSLHRSLLWKNLMR